MSEEELRKISVHLPDRSAIALGDLLVDIIKRTSTEDRLNIICNERLIYFSSYVRFYAPGCIDVATLLLIIVSITTPPHIFQSAP